MGQLPRHSDVRMLGLLLLVCAGGCGSPWYHWQGADQRFLVAERGRVLEVVPVAVREPYHTPFVTAWHHLLAQPCGETHADDGLPCWPASRPLKRITISQSALRTLTGAMPAYRRFDLLGRFAERVLPEQSHLGRVLIGTQPVAIALMENPLAGARLERSSSAGKLRFVASANLLQRATAVAVFPEGTDVAAATSSPPVERSLRTTLFTLEQPTPLRHLIDSVGDRAKLQQLSAQVIEVGVAQ
jgi:hypothetical protein